MKRILEDDKMIGEFSGKEIYQKLSDKIDSKPMKKDAERKLLLFGGIINDKEEFYIVQFAKKYDDEMRIFCMNQQGAPCVYKTLSTVKEKIKINMVIGAMIDTIWLSPNNPVMEICE